MSDPKYAVEMWPLDKLVPYEKNAKKHSPDQVKKLAALMIAKGFTQPIIVNTEGVIIGGHGRRLAAIEAGLKKVPVFIFRGSKADADALRLADNQIASKDYDMDLLQSEMSTLAADYDLSTLGYTAKDIEFMVTAPEDTMDESLFVDDIQDAVESQRETNDERAVEIDAATAPLADAFGFRRLTVAQSRRVRGFMNRLENESSQKGVDALMVFLDNMGVE